jgi:hypothetical protein
MTVKSIEEERNIKMRTAKGRSRQEEQCSRIRDKVEGICGVVMKQK